MANADYFVTCGAVIGDISGSTLERGYCKERPQELITPRSHFTDDTVLTCAIAAGLQAALELVTIDQIMSKSQRESENAKSVVLRELTRSATIYTRRYPRAGYGKRFGAWIDMPDKSKKPYKSYGNGAAMRCSYAGWIARTLEEAVTLGSLTAEITHNHPEGLKAAATISACIFMLRQGAAKRDILDLASRDYNLGFSIDALRPVHSFNSGAAGTVPVAIAIFLESESFEDTISIADSMAGDVDTLAAIAGSLAEAAYSIPDKLLAEAAGKLDNGLREDFTHIQERWLAAGHTLPGRAETLPALKPRIEWR